MNTNVYPLSADAGTPTDTADKAASVAGTPRDAIAPELPDDVLIILPVRNVVLFPGVVFPLTVGRERSRAAVLEAARLQRPLGILLQNKPEVDVPGADDLHRVGTSANVLRYITGADGAHHVICQGVKRFRVLQFLDDYPFTAARVEYVEQPEETDADIEGRALNLKQRATDVLQLLPQVPEEWVATLQGVDGPARLADFISGLIDIDVQEKQKLLETFDLKTRLDKLLDLLAHRIEVLKVSRDVDARTKESLGDRNRSHFLREQMRTIQKELGDEDESAAEIAELDTAITAAKMPDEVEKQARKELKRLSRMADGAGESSTIRSYLDWLIELPWAADAPDAIDIAAARRILDEDHYGLDKIKKRILEFLAVRKLNPAGKSPIMCFVGPHGVGKTSLGQSIAKATNRKFVRMSLGGVRDEAEIRGHRRTYIGSMPGKILQSLTKATVRNPFFLLDEVDKLGQDFRGDPSSALLEVLDPEQNHTFQDHYVEVDYDLSDVMFVATANSLNIPAPLLDRMEVIRLSGYTEEEKVSIALKFLLPKQIKNNGVKEEELLVTEEAVRDIVRYYTREAGVRSLERELSKICRKVVKGMLLKKMSGQVRVTGENLNDFLGVRKYSFGRAELQNQVGQVVGLAWTEVGGDLLTIEAALTPGKGVITRTGSLGDVMKESVEAARTVVRSRSRRLGIKDEVFEKKDIHIHVPDGATPKDGPSAGAAMTTAFVSALTGIPVRADVAMTGEITLRGEVTAIGGLKEKLLAALRGGIHTVLIPEENAKDLQDIPANVKDGLEIIPVKWIDKVLELALERMPTPLPEEEAVAPAAAPLPVTAADAPPHGDATSIKH